MSYSLSGQIWRHSKAKHIDKYIFLALADYANETTGLCCPSTASLAKKTGIGQRRVQKAIKKLVKIRELKRTRAHGIYKSRTYTFKLNGQKCEPPLWGVAELANRVRKPANKNTSTDAYSSPVDAYSSPSCVQIADKPINEAVSNRNKQKTSGEVFLKESWQLKDDIKTAEALIKKLRLKYGQIQNADELWEPKLTGTRAEEIKSLREGVNCLDQKLLAAIRRETNT